MSDTLPRLLTVAQVSEMIGIPERTLRQYKTDGKIPYVQVEGQIRFEEVAILRWIEDHRVEAVR